MIAGNLIDIFKRAIYPAEIEIEKGRIRKIKRKERNEEFYIIPGLIDSHIHIESSMCTPGSFSEEAVSRGTTAVVSDPHEIANVLGIAGVNFMIEDGLKVPLKFFFGAPSCVPATPFETSGAEIGINDIDMLLSKPEIKYLAEMMNFPGVIYEDKDVLSKIKIAHKYKKPVDGHAPGLSGDNLRKYIEAGISTDHECVTLEEAKEKIGLGMKVMIREGSAARNLDSLKKLIRTNPDMVMLCSDDLHPEMLARRHIGLLVAQLVNEGFDLFDVIRLCTLNPTRHYKLETGLLREGDPADFIIVDTPYRMNVLETWINGEKVFDRGKLLYEYKGGTPANKFNCSEITTQQISVKNSGNQIRVIEAFDGQIFTKEVIVPVRNDSFITQNPSEDLLKIVVKDRYNDSSPAVGFIKGFGLKKGAFASSVAHDSHNIICVGTNDNDIVNAINAIIKLRGGLSVAAGSNIETLSLPIAGIMSDRPVKEIAGKYEILSGIVKELGCQLEAPFMTLSFMALLVIPELKLSDRGLFDSKQFKFVPLTVS